MDKWIFGNFFFVIVYMCRVLFGMFLNFLCENVIMFGFYVIFYVNFVDGMFLNCFGEFFFLGYIVK